MHICYTLDAILALIGKVERVGTPSADLAITSIAALDRAEPGDLSFLGNLKYKHEVATCRASVILLPIDYEGAPAQGQLFLKMQDPSVALGLLCRDIEQKMRPRPQPGIHPTAVIDPTAHVAADAHIGPHCVISAGATVGARAVLQASVFLGRDVSVGEDSFLFPHVSILDYCQIGARAYFHPGVVIGSDGYGFATINGRQEKLPQIGHVVVEEDVEIGANTTIDRARLHETRIGAGTKIDNLVQIAHNVTIGKNCLIVALVGIAGSTKICDNVTIGGQTGIAGHLTIGKGVMIGGQSGVNHNIPEGSFVRGAPAMPYLQANKIDVLKRNLPELFKRIGHLEDTLKRLAPNP